MSQLDARVLLNSDTCIISIPY